VALIVFIAGLLLGMAVQSFRDRTAPPRWDRD
jgi:hypothetical protein